MIRLVLVWLATAAIAFSSIGCDKAPDLTPVPGQGLFTVIVWNDVFGRTDKAPAIEWRRDLTCVAASGFPGFENSDGTCVNGNWSGGDFVSVADVPGMRLSESGMLAHELLHVKLAREGRDDSEHLRPEWADGGLMDRANAALAAANW